MVYKFFPHFFSAYERLGKRQVLLMDGGCERQRTVNYTGGDLAGFGICVLWEPRA